MRLEKIRVDFEPEQDRLVMRILVDGQTEVLLWLTRRCVKRLWLAMLQLAEGKPEIQRQADPEARSAILQFAHEKALREVQLSTREEQTAPQGPQPPRDRPLGEAPLLIMRIQARRVDAERSLLVLLPANGQGARLTLGDSLIHGLMRLTQAAVEKAEWDMRLELPKPVLDAASAGTGRMLN